MDYLRSSGRWLPRSAARTKAVKFFQGFEGGGIVLEAGEARSAAVFESGFSSDEKMAAVQYHKFPVAEAMVAALIDSSRPAPLSADNRRYRASADIPVGLRQELIRDLG